MKRIQLAIALSLVSLLAAAQAAWAQAGPKKEGSETVARPRKKTGGESEAGEETKIPSKLSRKKEVPGQETPSFRTEVMTVSLDVAVLDNRGQFIPNIPRANFRVLEDNVPQQITGFEMGEAPMTVCLVIEFSNLFQQYWTETWYQTL
ncbi:MAG: VWA domain-containing protein, partial [Bryobacteraceae bacterium]